MLIDWKTEHDHEAALRREWSTRAKEAEQLLREARQEAAKAYLQGLVDLRLAIEEIEGEMSEHYEPAFVKIRNRMNEIIRMAAAKVNT